MTAPTPFGDVGPHGLPYCYRHPLRETGVRCVRCDRPICPDCMRPGSVGFMCPDDVKAGRIVTRTSVGAPVSRATQPYVTFALIGMNVAVYLITAVQSPRGFTENQAARLFANWVLQPYAAAHGNGGGQELYRLITSGFLHLGPTHLVLNMLALYFLGPPLERLLGWWRFTAVYGLALLGGSAAVYVFDTRYVAVAGASGAIYGLFAAALIMARRLGADMRSLAIVIVANFAFTFAISGVSKLGHVGGFVVGAIVAIALSGIALPGKPAPGRIPVAIQASALGGVLVVLLVAITLRTAAL
ncbi:MAG: Rhomboid family protein [Pseudonocardiales bacterium]|nr:Rhomboid family protein [Pseudonocardiales bacterium]